MDTSLYELRSLLDFGMVVILWLVQGVIYPAFLHCERDSLVAWHETYTRRVAWVIVPIMLSQLPLAAWVAWAEPTWNRWAALFCLVLCWLLTFGLSVPLHHRIAAGDTRPETLERLIRTNWPRTLLWTFAFLLGLDW